jgi:hypothetical protein
VLEIDRDLEVPAAERDAKGFSLGHVVLLPVTLPSGWCEIRLEASDLRSQKVGLAYIGKKAHHTGKIEGTVLVPDWSAPGVALSEIEPAWSIREGRHRRVPSPTPTSTCSRIRRAPTASSPRPCAPITSWRPRPPMKRS